MLIRDEQLDPPFQQWRLKWSSRPQIEPTAAVWIAPSKSRVQVEVLHGSEVESLTVCQALFHTLPAPSTVAEEGPNVIAD
mmetsp:Transcript_6962/g.18814  ORF Transcript_6962/g.18814 Transcript_6962/m.18814 type:complete len:80 (-) Transcript_6962:613-852(-)